MTTPITKEQELRAFITGFLTDPAHDEHSENSMTAQVFRIALASMDAEPIYQIWDDGKWVDFGESLWRELYDENRKSQFRIVYAAPPAPVVPDEVISAIENLKRTLVNCNRYNYCSDAVKRIENACRAAMLQAGNSPVIPDGWQLVPVEPTKEMIDAGWLHFMGTKNPSSKGTYKAMLAAAPQQEVAQALAKGMERYGDAMQELAKKEAK